MRTEQPTPEVDIECQLLFVNIGENEILVDIIALEDFTDGGEPVVAGTPVTLFLSPDRGRGRGFRQLVSTLERWAESTVQFRFIARALAIGRQRYELSRGAESIVLEVGL
jgi:hypothetical protein